MAMVQGGRDHSQGKLKLMSEINVTPLVDVMLVLLIIFMITSPMLVAGVNVDLPQTSAAPLAGQDEPLTVSIDKKGIVYILETPVERAELAAKLSAIAKAKMDTRIFVRGDKSVSYGDIVDVVSEITMAGFTKVALITQVKNDEKR
jgi:biopolymer transport protein TolR